MTTKTPIRTVYDAQNEPIGLSEFQVGEFLSISVGGTGGNTTATARSSLGVDNSNIRSLFSVSGSGTYDNTTGIITVTGGVVSVGGATGTVSNAQLASSVTSAGLLANTNLTGIPVAPTATTGTNTTQIATTAFVTSAVSNLIDSAPGALDTLNELAAAINDDNNFATTIVTQLNNKANTASLTTANVTEVTNLYFTNARATSAVVNTTLSNLTISGNITAGNANIIGTINVAEIAASGNITSPFFYSESDKNLKKNIEPLVDSLSVIKKLEGVKYEWIHDNQPSIGFIAQEVEEIIPSAVGLSPAGHKTIQYNIIIAFLVEAVKEQQNQIDLLKQQIENLNG